jgi:hypothetical protein
MNSGLIPPADVAAAAKKGLELREKFHRGGTSVGVIAQSSWRSAETSPCATSARLKQTAARAIAAARGPRRVLR